MRLVDGARGYIRVSPAGWRQGAPPAVNAVERYDSNFAVHAPAEGVASGSFGASEEGFVRYWLAGSDETANVAMFFDETGEFWVLHGTAVESWKGQPSLRVGSVLKCWSSVLRRANLFMDRFHASPVRRVEVGLVGLKGVRWPGQFEAERKPARKGAFILEAIDRDWTVERQRQFVMEAYSQLTNIFGWPKPSEKEAADAVDGNDSDRHLTPPWLD